MIRNIWLWLVLSLCLIVETAKGEILSSLVHEQNQNLCAQIVHQFCQTLPADYTPEQQAHALNLHLDLLGRQLFDQGVDLSIYTYDKIPNTPYLHFARIPFWEGASVQPEIPLTLFFYVWPPEQIAKQAIFNSSEEDPLANHYATNIHGHPLICALTVLRGSLYQENYEPITGWPFNVAKKGIEEIFQIGMMTFDDNTTSFIHRIVCRDEGPEPAISLHGYGASTMSAVRSIFISQHEQYSYPYVLQENGELVYQPW